MNGNQIYSDINEDKKLGQSARQILQEILGVRNQIQELKIIEVGMTENAKTERGRSRWDR